jgi:hypothetical protein
LRRRIRAAARSLTWAVMLPSWPGGRWFLARCGDNAARARWCNDRNVELFGDSDSDDLTVVGGWDAAPDGTCCLTTWQSLHFVRDEVLEAAGLAGNLLRYHQSTVLRVLMTEPSAVTGDPLTAEHLAAGLESVVSAFAEVLEYPKGTDWSAEPRAAGAFVTLEGRTWAGEPLAEMAYDDAADPGSAESGPRPPHSFRMAPTVLPGDNRTELSLLYSALLAYTQAIFMNHASGTVAPPDAEAVQVGDAIRQRTERRSLIQGCGMAGVCCRSPRARAGRSSGAPESAGTAPEGARRRDQRVPPGRVSGSPKPAGQTGHDILERYRASSRWRAG